MSAFWRLRTEVREARFAVLEALGQKLLAEGEPREAGKRFRELLEVGPSERSGIAP